MLNLKELIDVGCAQTMVDSDGQIYQCSKPIVAIRHWPDYGEGDSYSGVCQQHSQQAGIEFIPLKNVPNPLLLPFYLTYKDKTLHDTIDWCKEQIARINEMIPTASDENFLVGERFALQAVIAHCEEQLGYSGSMPLEVPKSERESNPLMLPEDTISLFVFRFLA